MAPRWHLTKDGEQAHARALPDRILFDRADAPSGLSAASVRATTALRAGDGILVAAIRS